eukprot:CAMPEP_0182419114 /NCGR_PEP_ID=MMETSP1167-20130531/3508_1 /TAXON_ID=2988 /ORGANISM="Mallomonas Sp, Strain CCMP3275" /LENGTH=397 /DNA_ID=CAMNT_0024593749 /DNA_START=85 /DNA_END=1278 /DNA_ORIENTATION=+
MDRLDKSLDELISDGQGKGGVRGAGSSGRRGRGGGGGRGRQASGGAIRSLQTHRSDRQASHAPYPKTTITLTNNPPPKKMVVVSRKPIVKGQHQSVDNSRMIQQPRNNQITYQQPIQQQQQQQQHQSKTFFTRGSQPPIAPAPPAPVVPDNRVTISNLNSDITAGEIVELYGSVGEIKGAEMKFDKLGQSLGVVEITYVKRADALAAVNKFDGATLDGSPMSVTLADSLSLSQPQGIFSRLGNASDSGSVPVGEASRRSLVMARQGAPGPIIHPMSQLADQSLSLSHTHPLSLSLSHPVNVREGLFGTAVEDDEEEEREREIERNVYYDDRGGGGMFSKPVSRSMFDKRNRDRGRERERERERSGGRGRGGRRGGGGRPSSGSDLDADLDAYMAGKA